jgi:hypothetical protein
VAKNSNSQGVSKTVYYRRHVDRANAFRGASLEQVLHVVFDPSHPKKVEECVGNRSIGNPGVHAINYFSLRGVRHDADSYFYGELLGYVRGDKHSYVDHQSNAKYLSIGEMSAGDNKDWIHSLLYFFVKGDHILYIPTSKICIEDLEDYLTWLLTMKTGEVEKGYRIRLEERVDAKVTGEDYENIKSFRIRDPNYALTTGDMLIGDEKSFSEERKRLLEWLSWPALKRVYSYFKNLDNDANENYHRLQEAYDLKAYLSFKVSRKSVVRSDKLDATALAQYLLQLPSDLVEIETPSGVIKEGKLRLQTKVKINTQYGSHQLDYEHGPKMLFSVYRSWLNGGRLPY